MAIIVSVPGIEVAICCNGIQLQEYPDDIEDGMSLELREKTVTKYVQSTAGAEFSVKYIVTQPFELGGKDLGFYITLDGETDGTGVICSPADLDEYGKWEYDVSGLESVYSNGATLRPFQFAKLLLTEDNIGLMSQMAIRAMKKVGLIEIKVHRLGKGRVIKCRPRKLKGHKRIPEKAIKGQSISHSIAYGNERALPKPSTFVGNAPAHDSDDYIAIFRFKYRSRDDLQREMIIPRTPSQEPPAQCAIGALTSHEKRRLAKMKFDDMEMLRLLTGSISGLSKACTFDNLEEDEIDVLAKTKYAEMTGIAMVKPEPAIKSEKGEVGVRMAIDLDDEPIAHYGASFSIRTRARAHGRTHNDTSVFVQDDDDDDICITEIRQVKKRKTLHISSIL